MNEKKFTYLLVSIAALAILIVILVNIPWGGKKGAIAEEYGLEKNHVLESITFKEYEAKRERKETFHVYIGSTKLNNSAKQFVFQANKLAKDNGITKIYYLDLSKLASVERDDIMAEAGSLGEVSFFPTLIYLTDLEEQFSSFKEVSGLKKLSDYSDNWSLLLSDYFKKCKE